MEPYRTAPSYAQQQGVPYGRRTILGATMDSRSRVVLLARFSGQFPRRAREPREAPGPSFAQDQRPGAIPNHRGTLKHP